MRFSVVIPTIDRVENLRATLASVAAADPPAAETIVVDGSPERSAEEVANEFAARYVHTAPGLTAQRNRGAEAAAGDVVVFLDDDVEVASDFLGRLDEVYEDTGIIGATGRVIEPESRRLGGPRSRLRKLLPGGGREGTFTRYGYPRYLRHPDRATDVEFMQGCLMTARRDAVVAVGFDEALPGYALGEDEDFSYRLSRLGRIRYSPDVVVRHNKLGFHSQDTRDFGRTVVRNRAYLFRKNFQQTQLARAQFVLLVLSLVGHRVVNREFDGARGLIDGARETWRDRS
jgi:GT2 family glycosyltransferase